MKYENIEIKNIMIGDIPAILLRPLKVSEKYNSLIFYHGWSSSKEGQVFRCFVYAALGYQVLIPDAINHGQRGSLDYGDMENAPKFWETVFQNVEESEYLIEALIKDYDAAYNKIAVSGHSMGGFSAAGVFAKNDILSCSVIVNGSIDWENSNRYLMEGVEQIPKEYEPILEKIKAENPMRNLESLINRPIRILHGEIDKVVAIEPQKEAYDILKEKYSQKEKVSFISYPNAGHLYLAQTLEDTATWLEEYNS